MMLSRGDLLKYSSYTPPDPYMLTPVSSRGHCVFTSSHQHSQNKALPSICFST